ncbi:hypothetical protein SAMN05428982_3401 [Pseudoxanthomonas sp. CF385]|nr:hypothetical protein SAMN05428982_3401 [Pseudoxanthomonas sp. CF385]
MTQHMSHEEYIQSVRTRVVEICSGILDGTFPVLEGCRLLSSLRWEAQVDQSDTDFDTFTAIDSETDALPIGEVRRNWDPEALQALEPEIRSATEWASSLALPACKAVVQRFGA